MDDVKALLGNEGFANAPLFAVEYFKDANFTDLAKKSVTPFIDFDLGTERGTGSPDASADVPQENFSVRWIGTILPPASGTYHFYIDGDNQVNFFVNAKLLLNKKLLISRKFQKKSNWPAVNPLKSKSNTSMPPANRACTCHGPAPALKSKS